ncbi:MAG: response regulator [Flavobacteriales bacterium]|nr:response regulator [Flavobacteriales bacterium]
MAVLRYILGSFDKGGTLPRYLQWLSVLLALQTLTSVGPALWQKPTLTEAWVLTAISGLFIVAGVTLRQREWQRGLVKLFHFYGMGLCMAVIFAKMGPDSCMMWLLTWTLSLVIAERREYMASGWLIVIMAYCMLLIGSRFVWNSLTIGNPWPPLISGVFGCIINTYLLMIDVRGTDNYFREIRSLLSQLDKLTSKITSILTERGELNYQLWRVSEECVPLLGLEDCVIYLYNEERGMLIQTAAFGDKRHTAGEILNPIGIKPGEGVVGTCFLKAAEMDIPDTALFPGYIIDDKPRNAELAVPIMSNGKVVGVFDSEHSERGFFKERHKQAFRIIAAFCGIKITEYEAFKSLEIAESHKREADRYKELDELKNRFITNISHDLKTPLSLIKAPAQQLVKESKDPQTRNLAGYILKNAEHLLKVMNQLLQLNRLDKGLNQLYIRDTDTRTVFGEIVAQYQGMIEEKRIQFSAQIENVQLQTDEFRLGQIVHNLLQNAFRYTPAGGEVRLACHASNEMLHIAVADSGPGIPEHLRERVFDRFFKVDVNNHEGTGVGLSLVKEYAAALGGAVSLEDNPGGGAVFTVQLPLVIHQADNQAEVKPQEPAMPEVSQRPVLLVVEDHPDLNNFICHSFERDFQCVQAVDGKEALNRVKEMVPDIIITDLMMPDTDGETLIARLREDDATAHIPIVVLTAKGRLQSKVDLYALGVENYLTKPFEIEELQAVVEGVLLQRKRLRDLFGQKYLSISPHPVEEPADEAAESEVVKQAVQWVLDHLENEQLGITDLSGALSIGRNRLQREIKSATGLTPVEFVRSVRLNEARKMLDGGNCNVSEAAFACGFSNLSYFARSFKNEFGYLPSTLSESRNPLRTASSDG